FRRWWPFRRRLRWPLWRRAFRRWPLRRPLRSLSGRLPRRLPLRALLPLPSRLPPRPLLLRRRLRLRPPVRLSIPLLRVPALSVLLSLLRSLLAVLRPELLLLVDRRVLGRPTPVASPRPMPLHQLQQPLRIGRL